MKAEDKAALIKTLRTIWSSLDSHLDYIIDPVKPKKFQEIHGSPRFHAKTVKEYAESIFNIAKLL